MKFRLIHETFLVNNFLTDNERRLKVLLKVTQDHDLDNIH